MFVEELRIPTEFVCLCSHKELRRNFLNIKQNLNKIVEFMKSILKLLKRLKTHVTSDDEWGERGVRWQRITQSSYAWISRYEKLKHNLWSVQIKSEIWVRKMFRWFNLRENWSGSWPKSSSKTVKAHYPNALFSKHNLWLLNVPYDCFSAGLWQTVND